MEIDNLNTKELRRVCRFVQVYDTKDMTAQDMRDCLREMHVAGVLPHEIDALFTVCSGTPDCDRYNCECNQIGGK